MVVVLEREGIHARIDTQGLTYRDAANALRDATSVLVRMRLGATRVRSMVVVRGAK